MRKQDLMKKFLELTKGFWNRPEIRRSVRKNFRKVITCGTAALGWELYASDNEEKRCYHRCKSRFCASCGYRATLLWLAYQAAALPDIPYRGIVFTMPRELWAIFKRNRHLLHDLPALAASVIQQWARMKFGAEMFIIVVPHTFGGDLKFNSHLHMLISAGGYSRSQDCWIPDVVLNQDALMKMWRYTVITHLRRALRAKILKSPRSPLETGRILTAAYQGPKWVLLFDEITSKEHFLRYAARYIRRPPLASWRLLAVSEQGVRFVAKDTERKRKVRTQCSLIEFLRLIIPHVSDCYRHSVRYFGLLASRARAGMQAAMSMLLSKHFPAPPSRTSWRESIWLSFGVDPLIDSFGQTMHWVRRERLPFVDRGN